MDAQTAPDISAGDIRSKKRIGKLDGSDVWHLETTGGYHLVVKSTGQSVQTLGCGPHRAVARYTAEKHFPSLQINELAKSDLGQLSREEMRAALPDARAVLSAIWQREDARK